MTTLQTGEVVASDRAPAVTAVIPAYNAASFIERALRSVLAQTHRVAEIIVVDDGSSDRTAELAAAFPHVRVIRRANGGPGAARNTGVDAASSEWIAFLDSDDSWAPSKTESQLKLIAADVGVVYVSRFDPINFGALWHRQATFTPTGALVRRQALSDAGGFDESRAIIGTEDLDMWIRIALAGWRFVRSAEELIEYSPTEQSLSRNHFKMARAELSMITTIGSRVHCQGEEIERIKQASRIEYVKNLIADQRWDEAQALLRECAPGMASRWLALVAYLRTNRLARTRFVRWLHSKDARYGARICSGECTLPTAMREQCMETCRTPYYRPDPVQVSVPHAVDRKSDLSKRKHR